MKTDVTPEQIEFYQENGYTIIEDFLTPHGAGANMTPGWRRAMTCGYMPDGSTFNGIRNILPQDYVDTLAIGDVLADDTLNPLIWHNTKPYMNS